MATNSCGSRRQGTRTCGAYWWGARTSSWARSVRRCGQRPPDMGTGTEQARWQERQEEGEGGGRAQARGADAQALGDRRGLRADGLPESSLRGGRAKRLELRSEDMGPEALSNHHEPPRPGDCETLLEPPRARRTDGSAVTVRTPVCTGPQRRPFKSADGSMAERWIETASGQQHLALDCGRPPHGSRATVTTLKYHSQAARQPRAGVPRPGHRGSHRGASREVVAASRGLMR
jgi:hypothetical protein